MYEGIAEIHIQLDLNAVSVHLDLGNGELGLLTLTVAIYNTFAGVPFNPPANPGQMCIILPNYTGPQIAALDQDHKILVCVWKEYLAVDRAL